MLEVKRHAGFFNAQPEDLDQFVEVLENYPLDRRFEAFGNFIIKNPSGCTTGVNPFTYETVYILNDEPLYPGLNVTQFWGNFYNLSHVFCITTDEPEIIKKLTKAIRKNQKKAEYLAQPIPTHKRAKTLTKAKYEALHRQYDAQKALKEG